MTIFNNKALPRKGASAEIIEPEIVKENYRQPPDNTKKQKKIKCCVVSGVDTIEKNGYYMPTLVAKPVKVKYGQKWFVVNNKRYWIIYSMLKDFGKFYMYFTDVNNAVGGIKFYEHGEFADPDQVELMVNQHAVEVHKKHKGIPIKMLLIIGIALLVTIVLAFVLVNMVIGLNNQLGAKNTQINNLTNENKDLKCTIDPTLTICQVVIQDTKSTGVTKK
jgi:hypothetical protein